MDAEQEARLQHGAWLPGPRLEELPRPRRRWPWLLLGVGIGLVVGFLLATSAYAIPACWHMAPHATEPGLADATPFDCGGTQALVLDGIGALDGMYLEVPESSLWVGQVYSAEVLDPQWVWFWFSMVGPRVLIDPDIYVTQWLLGSTWHPASARWWHEHVGIPEWGPYVAPDDEPLAHSPEPSTLLLLASTLAGVGWRVRRGR